MVTTDTMAFAAGLFPTSMPGFVIAFSWLVEFVFCRLVLHPIRESFLALCFGQIVIVLVFPLLFVSSCCNFDT